MSTPIVNANAKSTHKHEKLSISFDDNKYGETKEILLNGALSIFVNCGRQYAIGINSPQQFVIR